MNELCSDHQNSCHWQATARTHRLTGASPTLTRYKDSLDRVAPWIINDMKRRLLHVRSWNMQKLLNKFSFSEQSVEITTSREKKQLQWRCPQTWNTLIVACIHLNAYAYIHTHMGMHKYVHTRLHACCTSFCWLQDPPSVKFVLPCFLLLLSGLLSFPLLLSSSRR